MRALALLALLAILLAGCSGGDGGGPAPPAPSSSSTSTGPAAPPAPTTDTLHFLDAPRMTPVPPAGGSTVRTPVTVSDFGGPGGGNDAAEGATWSHSLARAANITGAEVHVWVEVLETMYHTPSTPLEEACTWQLTTLVGIGGAPQVNCLNEPAGPINPGVKELAFTLVLDGTVAVEAGERISVTLQRDAFSLSPNNAVDALSGSSDHPSRIVLKGLAEPMVE